MIFFKKKKKGVPLKEHRRIVKHLRDEILRKDRIIKELKEKNSLIITASIKQAQRNDEVLGIVKQLKRKITEKEEIFEQDI